jgi:poly(hydroxyalkanoate) depolymerase family esterase
MGVSPDVIVFGSRRKLRSRAVDGNCSSRIEALLQKGLRAFRFQRSHSDAIVLQQCCGVIFFIAVQQPSGLSEVIQASPWSCRVSLADNIEFLRRLPKFSNFSGLNALRGGFMPAGKSSPLLETTGFGANPGDLRMFSVVPGDQRARQKLSLVVVLHGCSQSAAGYDVGAGWSALAESFGFALLMPEQKHSNNANGCFNWFVPEDTTRDSGEAASIRQMVARMVRDHNIDESRIFVTGLSAGGAMTSVMLATYPDVFAGGAVIAGLPYGVATNLQQALNGMFQSRPRPAAQLGDLVRNASPYRGPWPKLSIWHGSADKTVNPANADELVKQWLDVHHLPPAPTSRSSVDGYPHQVWHDADGETVVESYTITNMTHGTPLGLADNAEHYGEEGAFLIEAGISSSYHIAKFFGLTAGAHQPAQASTDASAQNSRQVAMPLPLAARPARPPDIATVLEPLLKINQKTKPADQKRPTPIDVGGIITRALTAAGLMK